MGTTLKGTDYKFLEPRPGSSYRQFFVKDRRIRAEVLYRATAGSEPMTIEEVAYDYGVPVEAVRESIHYAETHEELLAQERERDWAEGESRPTPATKARSQVIPPAR